MIDKSKLLMVSPTPAEVKIARETANLTTAEAASLFGLHDGSSWRRKEILQERSSNKRLLKPAEYEMLLLIAGIHPNFELMVRK
ncbi:hypothetical protein [Photorhabdus cinerea]|uniref:Uncharacterized protein n=1 Tax=Photorhabdus cinerea TaxID=471575 RepID=A0A7X5THZ7_9GAMM|nr:hypothetical protein [Photorhabdus cinerea]NHB94381.1 hypothetical protein [Photorhabdus cinerea]